jgi:DNA repair exonuclease SbcCD ATPase subunit
MIDIKEKAKITFHWKVTPYDYSNDKVNSIKAKASKKYGIPKDKITVVPDFIMIDQDGTELSINKDVVQNIQDPNFQIRLFEEYIKVNNINDCDFELIKKIDAELNGKIDYQVYDKYCRYSIKWVRWSNFLSYGADNYFDFTDLSGLVLLSGEDGNQNQCGKTTLAIDLIHFLLFGKTDKADVQSKIFNKHIPEATTVTVEGCLTINDEDYIIKRTLTRPSLDKRTEKSKVTQKVEYYRIVAGSEEELTDYIDNQQEENSIQTNKVIKDAIGKESDFDLVMSITESNLDELIEKKDTESGRLLTRWIGLLPIEEKNALAREKFNGEIKPSLLSNHYNSETLKNELDAFKTKIKFNKTEIDELKKNEKRTEKEIEALDKIKETLLSSKLSIDDNLLKVDIATLRSRIESLTTEGLSKKQTLSEVNESIEKIGEVDFSVEEYDKIVNACSVLIEKRGSLLEKHNNTKNNIEHLKNSEYCPVCKRKLDTVDNSKQIKEMEKQLEDIISEGKKVGTEIAELEGKIESLKTSRDLFNEKNKLIMQRTALELSMSKLREELKDKLAFEKEYKKNSNAIDKNNELDIQIRNNESLLSSKRREKEVIIRDINDKENEIKVFENNIKEREEIISKIAEEEKLIYNWKIYLDMVGKNGISKMVLRKTLPIINANLANLLGDVCDFDVEVGINMKNDVNFYLVKDGVRSDLNSGSGFEKTMSSLALRSVLSDLSTVPRSNGILLDEVTGRVSSENLENVHKLLDKISVNYDYMFIVSHLDEIKSWATKNVKIRKENNISSIVIDELKGEE